MTVLGAALVACGVELTTIALRRVDMTRGTDVLDLLSRLGTTPLPDAVELVRAAE